MYDIQSMSLAELTELTVSLGEPKYRASQVYSWLMKGEGFDGMTNVPAAFRAKLAEAAPIFIPVIKRVQVSSDGTRKYLFGLRDGHTVESVFMSYEHGNTVCVSSQVGCRMGCVFCATGAHGFVRDLTAGEMLFQLIAVAKDTGKRVDGFVLMGMGEPLDNYENVLKFIRLASAKEGLGIGMRHISLSTCGIVPKIDRLAEENLQITLSVSLHCPSDEGRSKIMPVNNAYPLPSLIDACRRYVKKTGRRISFEYALISGKTDKKQDADMLISLLAGMLCHVNLIILNEVGGKDLKAPDEARAYAFCKALCDGGLNATVRRRLGRDIDAACGQLYEKSIER